MTDAVLADELVLFKRTKNGAGAASDKNGCLVKTIAGVSPIDIQVAYLRKFCARHHISRDNGTALSTAGSKVHCMHAIQKAALDPNHFTKSKLLADLSSVKKKQNVRMNRNRFCNVLFGDVCRNDVATRGASLTADEQTLGLKTDQLLHEKICCEYNSIHKYNEHAFPALKHEEKGKGNRDDPGNFLPIKWLQSKTELDKFLSQYEKCFNNWKKSGNHGEFIDITVNDVIDDRHDSDGIIPFVEFIQNNNSLLYLHKFVYQFPDIFRAITGSLPIAAESIGASPVPSSTLKKRKRTKFEIFEESFNSEAKQEALTSQAIAFQQFTIDSYRRSIDVAYETAIRQ